MGFGERARAVAARVTTGLAGAGPVFAPDEAPPAPVAVVFGASVAGGRPGSFVEGRLQAVLRLYQLGTAPRILISGNAGGDSGDEIVVMSRWLVEYGVPPSALLTDGDALDTYLACLHARDDFRLRRVLLVSQPFHARRAAAIARHLGLDADPVGAGCASSRRLWWRNLAREYLLSRPKAALDLARQR